MYYREIECTEGGARGPNAAPPHIINKKKIKQNPHPIKKTPGGPLAKVARPTLVKSKIKLNATATT